MKCRRVRKLLTEYADETLSISVEEQVRLHLSSCRQCAMLSEELAHVVGVLQALPKLETSPDFAHQLRRHLPVAVALSRRPTARSGFLSWLHLWRPSGTRRLGLVLTPIALGLGLALYLFSFSPLGSQGPVANMEPVISEGAYLATIAREHAGYVSEHPLIDSSAANLKAVATATLP
ncbi:MAG TPA: zf-HC2 domain-containing protein [Armatimonadetes bacterium]|jgi:hypothetical protein|nr:zf-HC2 domain-containing protein [Armatimonadota bacterium]